ncbi:hypothetical protein EfmAA242_12600 [Enterococcus faecium]|nr:hypothetical protein EfmAA242_12600 [Enterococcus faecium]
MIPHNSVNKFNFFYDDELGVKLTNDKKRVLFDGQEDLLTEQNQSPFEQMKEFHFTKEKCEQQTY